MALTFYLQNGVVITVYEDSDTHGRQRIWAEESAVIPFRVLKRYELGPIKLSLDVEIPLVEGRLPTEAELASLSRHLVSQEKTHERTFVVFYLPGMEVDAGGFATAHHNPELEVNILEYKLIDYPQYHFLLSRDLREYLESEQ